MHRLTGHLAIRHRLGQLQHLGRQVQYPPSNTIRSFSGTKRDAFGEIFHQPLPHIVCRHLTAPDGRDSRCRSPTAV